MKIKKYLLFSLLLSLFVACSGNKENGGGTETGDPGAIAELKSGLISGKTVLDESSNISVENVTLWLDDKDDKKSYSGDQGEFLFQDLSIGEHVIYAQWKSESILLMGKSDVFEVGVATTHQRPFIYLGQSIILSAPASLKGLIADSSATVVKLKNSIFQTKVLSNGAFEMENLPAGGYVLEFINDNKVISSQEIELISGESLDLGVVSITQTH